MAEFIQEIVIKKGETITLPGGLTITNTGGGHKILKDRSDRPFAMLSLKLGGKKEELCLMAPLKEDGLNEKFWNGYVLKLLEQEFYGQFSKLIIRKPEEIRITSGQPFKLKRYESGTEEGGLKITNLKIGKFLTVKEKEEAVAPVKKEKWCVDLNVFSQNVTRRMVLAGDPRAPGVVYKEYVFRLISIDPSQATLLIQKQKSSDKNADKGKP